MKKETYNIIEVNIEEANKLTLDEWVLLGKTQADTLLFKKRQNKKNDELTLNIK